MSSNSDFSTSKSNLPLLPYQKIGLQWLIDLYELQLGGILADDMGLGKTIQAIALLDHLHNSKNLNHCLIIVPTSLIYNWQTEIQKFSPQLPFTIFESKVNVVSNSSDTNELANSIGSSKIIIASYGQLLHNSSWFEQVNWNIVIFDEAQNLKNLVSQRTAAARKLKSHMKIALTGTPMENHYGEFYSLVDLVTPGALGDYDHFKKTFQINQKASERDYFDPRNIDFLKLKTKPIILRRKKSDILNELPEKNEADILLNFDKKQKKLYRDIAIACNSSVLSAIDNKGVARAQIEMLSALLKLRKICTSPKLIPGMNYNGDSPKIERCIEMVEELVENNVSVLIFTTFITTIDLIAEKLKNLNIKYSIVNGKTSRSDRTEILEDFNISTSPIILLMTLKTGGVGLNLTRARYVVHLEPWWNPAVENQATDRVHRMGQDKSVYVYRLLMNHSVEEKIQILKNRKGKLFNSLFENDESASFHDEKALQDGLQSTEVQNSKLGSRITQEDFQYLLQ